MSNAVKNFILVIGIIVVLGIVVWFLANENIQPYRAGAVTSFEDCLNSGYTLSGEDVIQCTTPEGEIFYENENNSANQTACQRYTFDKYKINDTHNGPIKNPDFTASLIVNNRRADITNGVRKNGINFAGHYSIVSLSCGASCQESVIIDIANGRIINAQVESNYGIESRPNSNLLLVNPPSGLPDGLNKSELDLKTIYYIMDNNQLTQVCEKNAVVN